MGTMAQFQLRLAENDNFVFISFMLFDLGEIKRKVHELRRLNAYVAWLIV